MSKSVTWILFVFLPCIISGQSHNYWTRSFNEESSLLSGAVVGGGSGPSAIYYNPASISEVKASKFSLNASLFSVTGINARNALGDDLDLKTSKGNVEPRFVSYMIKSKRFKRWSFEVAFLNNENERLEVTSSIDKKINVLTNSPGDDRYFAFYNYRNQFRDDWIGFGASTKLNDRFIIGMSMFTCLKSLKYTNSIEIDAYPLSDSVKVAGNNNSFYVAGYEENYYLKFNNYRLLWKAGLLYKWESLSIGLAITTPSVGVYSDGKRVERHQGQSNITDPVTGEPMPDYLFADYEEKDSVKVSFKTPFSVSAGMTYDFNNGRRVLYLSMEYFFAVDPYRMVEANESELSGSGFEGDQYSDWLTYASGAKPVFNFAFGYSWTLNEKLLLKSGFRTDFNYQKNLDFGDFAGYSTVQKINLDRYYLTSGLSWEIFGQDIITGIQYSFGKSKDQKQIVNLSDPVEYNLTEQKALQGTRTNDMTTSLNAIVFYLGFSLNFGEK